MGRRGGKVSAVAKDEAFSLSKDDRRLARSIGSGLRACTDVKLVRSVGSPIIALSGRTCRLTSRSLPTDRSKHVLLFYYVCRSTTIIYTAGLVHSALSSVIRVSHSRRV